MIARLLLLCERAADIPNGLPAAEHADAKRLLTLCQVYAEQARDADAYDGDASSLTRELGRLVEYLGRRHARGIVLATLGRATLAHLARQPSAHLAACQETEMKLGLMGL